MPVVSCWGCVVSFVAMHLLEVCGLILSLLLRINNPVTTINNTAKSSGLLSWEKRCARGFSCGSEHTAVWKFWIYSFSDYMWKQTIDRLIALPTSIPRKLLGWRETMDVNVIEVQYLSCSRFSFSTLPTWSPLMSDAVSVASLKVIKEFVYTWKCARCCIFL